MDFVKRCWAEISVDALISNLNRIKSIIKDKTDIMCVVKANAYGHGDEVVSRELEKVGVKYFAVASVNEAVHLRKSGVSGEILVLGGCLEDCFALALDYDITLTVFDFNFASKLSEYALSIDKKAKVHVKLNTGMTRIGFDSVTSEDCQNTANSIVKLTHLGGLTVCGVFTHFSASDEQNGKEYTDFQFKNFNTVRELVEKRGIRIEKWHCSNSGAIINRPDCCIDMVRTGIALYGLYDGYGKLDGFTPAMTLKSVITQIREIEKNVSVSYGRTFVSDDKKKIATVSIGYGDGYPRSMSNKGKVLINGRLCNIVGRVCMDQIVVDVSGVDCGVSDTVTVMGTKQGITANDIAILDGTIGYEIVCDVLPRVPRVYFKNGEIIQIKEYI